ncbi:MAG: hypothetical protein ACYC2H_07250 [Thermoplasmatota archaeon]
MPTPKTEAERLAERNLSPVTGFTKTTQDRLNAKALADARHLLDQIDEAVRTGVCPPDLAGNSLRLFLGASKRIGGPYGIAAAIRSRNSENRKALQREDQAAEQAALDAVRVAEQQAAEKAAKKAEADRIRKLLKEN